MANGLTFWLGFAVFSVMLASVYGSVERRERVAYILGVALILVGLTFLSTPPVLSKLLVLGGIIAILVSTVPLLRESGGAV